MDSECRRGIVAGRRGCRPSRSRGAAGRIAGRWTPTTSVTVSSERLPKWNQPPYKRFSTRWGLARRSRRWWTGTSSRRSRRWATPGRRERFRWRQSTPLAQLSPGGSAPHSTRLERIGQTRGRSWSGCRQPRVMSSPLWRLQRRHGVPADGAVHRSRCSRCGLDSSGEGDECQRRCDRRSDSD